SVPMFDVTAAAGGGRMEHDAGTDGALSFPASLLRRITAAPANGLRLITISGDSMAPTLEHGDMVMVDTNRTNPSPPGIFVLDDGVGLVAKRVDAIPNTTPRMLRLSSDNPAYSNYQRRIDEVRVIGRVVWFARSL
ncbi:MAG: S24 family peptidase, partial [Alphaproteobacteria bacterium]